MTSKDRLLIALEHKEPDRIPYDLGATVDTGIHYLAYQNLLTYLKKEYLCKEKEETTFMDYFQGVVQIDEEIFDQLKVDVRGIMPNNPSNWRLNIEKEGRYETILDELGMKWFKLPNGYYFDQTKEGHPLANITSAKEIENYNWPNVADPNRMEGLREKIKNFGKEYPIAVGDPFGGIFALGFRMRGYENFYLDLAGNPSLACSLMDKLTDLKIQFWDTVLDEIGDLIHIIVIEDDLGEQDRTIVSPKMYRKLVKPRHKRLFSFIKPKAPELYIFFHSDGSIYDVIPDLIEIGIDILNPIQVSAAKMDTKRLKKEFGNEITFWGGGCDTQRVLPYGILQEVRDEVKKRIDDLAPGGGFIFNTVHNIQADVPPENIMAMWETLQRYGKY